MLCVEMKATTPFTFTYRILAMRLGTTIAELRRKQGIKQKLLAERCGITPTYLSQIENNHKDPTLPVLDAIGKQLKVPLPFLFFLATDEQDVPKEKREAYALLAPSINSLISALLSDQHVQQGNPS